MKNLIIITLSLVFAQPVMALDERLVKGESDAAKEFRARNQPYNAIESDALRIYLDGSLKGFVEGRTCDACKKIKVAITPKTKAFSGRVEVPLKKAKARLGKYATVIYEIKTKKVTQIRW
ncbi:hypothetical protein MNBD_GAMMA06-718 [hydrothermal vent metagenome]|uniref:Uncharacterized protein n=1 Tax=hydrothermal vent metagenome TaxID=652676 RepID=A0A3B0WLR2_9ZZZZ